ncbi:hypothetical protein PoB_001544300 [Plakobranchus ocellatus]|uniref:Uncharacterized protein n=1 Tax=Plakobranchus ocellatus TaxID=259542 RepID=A0AAV3Z2E0_9GAST|nr:hypothetical protein PoB_001544300 [Plakobranchus ocellatus]
MEYDVRSHSYMLDDFKIFILTGKSSENSQSSHPSHKLFLWVPLGFDSNVNLLTLLPVRQVRLPFLLDRLRDFFGLKLILLLFIIVPKRSSILQVSFSSEQSTLCEP